MSQWFQRFVASGVHGEVSDATIQGYLRSASQLEDVWQQIDDKVDAFMLQGMAPWEAYAKMAYALAFVRACRMNVVFVQELLKANAMANPTNASYLPKVTYEQALALCEHIEPFIEEAVKAATSPNNLPHLSTFPFALGPHVGYANQHIPLAHLQGFLGAAQQMRDWTAGLLAKYELALHAAKSPVPQPVTTHIEEMNRELGLGDFHLRTGVDMAGQISNGQVTDELSVKAIGFLWEAMESFFKLSQLIAFPGMSARPQQQHAGMKSPVPQYPDRHSNVAPRPQPPIVATPPEPEVADLLNQVTAGPAATLSQAVPTPPAPEVSNMFNEVTADSSATQAASTPPAPDVSTMLNQVTASQEVEQTKPNTPSSSAISAMFDQVTAPPETTQAGLMQTEVKGSQEMEQVPHPDKALPEDDIMKMFSDVCKEQKPNE